MNYLLVEKKLIEKNGKVLVKLAQLKKVGNYEVLSNELVFWLDKEVKGLNEAVEGQFYEPSFNITQKGYEFKVYLNGLVSAQK